MKTNEFLEAMERLIKSRFTLENSYMEPSMNGAFYLGFRIGFHTFMLYDNAVVDVNLDKDMRFDIANPGFDPEDIIRWISDRS